MRAGSDLILYFTASPKNPLKILEISSCFPPSRGGVERCVYELSTRFARDGNDVTVATSSRGKKEGWLRSERIDDIHVIRYHEKHHLFEAPLMPILAFTALTADYDVLHVHGMAPTITDLSMIFAKLRGKPVVLTYHNDAESREFGRLGRLAALVYSSIVSVVIRSVDVVVCSTLSYARTSPALKFSMNKLQIIPMGVDISRFEQFDFSRDRNFEHTLLFVGQLKEYKGVAVLLEAISYMRSQGHLVRVNIVGMGPELENLKMKAKNLNIEESVSFLGNVSDKELLQLYSTCDSVVLPSVNRREAFGIVLLEAMAAGKTVVASDIPGVREIATMAGYLAKPNDARSLADSILHSIGNLHHPERVRKVAYGFSWDALAAKYESIFKELVKR